MIVPMSHSHYAPPTSSAWTRASMTQVIGIIGQVLFALSPTNARTGALTHGLSCAARQPAKTHHRSRRGQISHAHRAPTLRPRPGRLEMTDQNQSSPTPQREPTAHPCDAPGLGPRAFLLAVMHDRTLALTHRMDAAARLLRLYGEESFRPPRLTYRIEGIDPDHLCAERRGSVFERRGSGSDHPPEADNRKSQPFLSGRSNNHASHDRTQGPSNIETNTEPLTFDQIQEIKAAVQRLHPDADLSQVPDHLTLCECGHWMLFPCKCVRVH